MNRIEIESLVHRLLDDVAAGRPVEDDRVELKREWPLDFAKAARRVAGHANAARQEPIIWVIGIDEEDGSVIGAAAQPDPAEWSQRLTSAFSEGWGPMMATHNIPRDGKIVVAVVFSTEGAPYLVPVKNTDAVEVPWRMATRIRSAKRQELFSILSPPTPFPDFEILTAELTIQANRRQPPGNIFAHTIAVSYTMYVVPRSDRHIFFPVHRSRFSVKFAGDDEELKLGPVRWVSVDDDPHVKVERRQMGLTAPGFVKAYASTQFPLITCPASQPISRLVLGHSGSTTDVVELRVAFAVDEVSRQDFRSWTFGEPPVRSLA